MGALSELISKLLLTRKVEAETPIQQSLQYQYEQAFGYWWARVQEVCSEEEWKLLRALLFELGDKLARKDGIAVDAQIINVLNPTFIENGQYNEQ